MACSTKLTTVLILLYIALLPPKASSSGGAEVKKEWTFKGENGDLQVSATSFPRDSGGRSTTIEIWASIGGSWTVAQEAAALDSVLSELPKAGFDTRSLSIILLRLNERDAISRLAAYAAESNIWRSELKTRSPAKYYPLIASFLNASGAYREWNDVFAKRGFALRVAGVEKVGVEAFSKSGAKCPTGTSCENLLVPNDALIQINVESLKPQ